MHLIRGAKISIGLPYCSSNVYFGFFCYQHSLSLLSLSSGLPHTKNDVKLAFGFLHPGWQSNTPPLASSAWTVVGWLWLLLWLFWSPVEEGIRANKLIECHSSTLHQSHVEQNLLLIQQNKGKRAQYTIAVSMSWQCQLQKDPGQYLEATCVSACCLPS